jgi:glycosyltransferase involved in cell wall biosynthesis
MKVSVAVITYNQEKFIAQAIESVLMQEADFDYELIIGEDCSTDRTREIVVDYHKRFPDKIRLLLPEQNLGAVKNFFRTIQSCRGQYVALLEGDDYWTSPHKLQKQVDFLDTHPECALCFHPVRWFYEDAQSPGNGWPEHNSVWPQPYRETSTIEDLLRDMFIQTASVVLRNGRLASYPEWLYTLRMGDWPLCTLYAQHGSVACLNEVMSAYRNHQDGIWFSIDNIARYKETIKMYDCFKAHLNSRYAKIIRPILADYCFRLAVLYDQNNDYACAMPLIKKSLLVQLQNKQVPSLNHFKMMARYMFPSLYAWVKRLSLSNP